MSVRYKSCQLSKSCQSGKSCQLGKSVGWVQVDKKKKYSVIEIRYTGEGKNTISEELSQGGRKRN